MEPIGLSGLAPLDLQRHLAERLKSRDRSLFRLATGQRLNHAADGPAAMITSQNLLHELAKIQAEGQSLERTDLVASTADAALGQISDLLVEANALAVANANGAGLSAEERQANQAQLNSILSTVNRLAGGSSFAGQPLFDGSVTIGEGSGAVELPALSTSSLGQVEIDNQSYSLADVSLGGALDTSVAGGAAGAQQVIAAAQTQITTLRGRIGGYQAYTLQPRLNALHTALENVAAAHSQLADTDFALETASLARDEVLIKASILLLNKKTRLQSSLLSLLA